MQDKWGKLEAEVDDVSPTSGPGSRSRTRRVGGQLY